MSNKKKRRQRRKIAARQATPRSKPRQSRPQQAEPGRASAEQRAALQILIAKGANSSDPAMQASAKKLAMALTNLRHHAARARELGQLAELAELAEGESWHDFLH